MAILAFPSVAILDSTAAGRSLLTAASASAQRSLLGLGTLATQNGNIADYLTTASAATTYQPLDSDLTAIAALTTNSYGRSLLTQADAPTARTTLGLGTGDSPTFSNATATNRFFAGNGTTTVPSISFANFTGTGFSSTATSILDFAVGGNHVARLSNAGNFAVLGTGSIGFANGAADNTADTLLFRDAANILAQRNGVNAQTLRVYNTFTDVNNFERGFLRWSSNVLQLGTEIAGTGTSRNLQLIAGGSARITVDTAGRVGIDNVTPQTLLHVGAGSGALTIPNGVGGSITAQVLHSATSGSVAIACGIQDGTNNRRIGFFMNQTDGICGIGQTMSSGSIPFVITMAAERFRISPAGDVGISTNNPAARLHVKGSGNSSATFGLNVENSDGTHVFRVRDDGGFHIGPTTNSTNGAFISPSDGADNIGTTTLSGLRYRSSLSTSGSGSDHFFRNYQGSRTNTSGNANLMEFTGAFAPTSGTGIYNLLSGSITVNQTGGANGITRGIHINPTLTAAADFRAIETTNGSWRLTDTYAAGSGSLASSALEINQTWNTTGTPTAIKLNVTNTASGGLGKLLDVQLGGTSKFTVTRDGVVRNAAIAAAYADSICISATATTRCFIVGYLNGNNVQLASSTTFGWTAGTDAFAALETILVRDAAYTIAQRNGVNPQALRVYNTYTSGTDYERGKFAWESNILRIGTEKLGTGAARALELQTDGTTRLTLATNGTATFSSSITVGPDASGVMLWFTAGQAFRVAGSVTSTTSLFFDVPRLFFRDMSNGYANSLSIVNSDIGIGTNAPTERFEVSGGKTLLAASTTSKASLNIPSGSDPTSPNNGDIWQNSNLLKVRLNGRTQTLSYQITSGTAAPSGGSDGDIYLQYT